MRQDIVSNEEIIQEARRRVPQGVWDYLVGGSASETTLRRNRHAFDRIAFRPRVLVDVSEIDPSTTFLGQKLRIRYMNEGQLIHPMHLHGMPQLVIAKDGWAQPQPWLCDTLNVAPGERWDVIVECTEVGVWAFHCHILSHAESEHGMYGMVTALIVKEAGAAESRPGGEQTAVAAFANNPFVCQLS